MKSLSCVILLLLTLETTGQIDIGGKYSRGDYPSTYVILNNDSTFKYKFNFDINWDLACGTYTLKKDLIKEKRRPAENEWWMACTFSNK